MFFLLRASAIIAFIYTYSPVHDGVEGFGRDDVAWDQRFSNDALASLIDETAYEHWTALPQHARDRLTIEIARQLADAAAMR